MTRWPMCQSMLCCNRSIKFWNTINCSTSLQYYAKELPCHNASCCGSYLFSVEGHFFELNHQSLPYGAPCINNSL